MKRLGLFAKFWQPGQVKTRLSKNGMITPWQASQVYQLFLEHLVTNLGGVADRRDIVFAPPDRQCSFQSLAKEQWNLVPQTPGDLGERMANYFDSCWQSKNSPLPGSEGQFHPTRLDTSQDKIKVVVIGGDCPLLTSVQINQAFERLDSYPVVIGPSTDGGYYLIGMNQPVLNAFSRIQWSTPAVFSETVKSLEKEGVAHATLPHLTDVDEWEDLLNLLEMLETPKTPSQHQLKQQLEVILGNSIQ